MSRSYRVLVALAVVLGLALRLAWIQRRIAAAPHGWSWRQQVAFDPRLEHYDWTHDEYLYYVSTAVNAFEGRGFFPDYNRVKDGVYVPPPLQSLFLLAVFRAAGHLVAPFALLLLQGALAGAMIVAVAEVARRLAGPAAGVTAAVLATVYPEFVFWSGYLLTESNYLAGLALLLLLAVRWAERPSAGRAVATAACLGLLDLQRANGLLLGPALAAFAFILLGWRRGLASAAAFLLVPPAVLLPWLVRNLQVYGEPIWVNSNAGVHLYLANHPGLDSRRTPYLEQVQAAPGRGLDPEIEARYRRPDGTLRVTYYGYSKVYLRAVRAYVLGQPFHFLRNYAVKLVNEFVLVQDQARTAVPPFSSRLAYRLLQGTLLVGGLLGVAAVLTLRRNCAAALLAFVFAYFAAVGALSILTTDGRYNLPLKMFLMIFLPAGVSALIRPSRRRPIPLAPQPSGRSSTTPAAS